jgi:hypothetical protein
VVVVIWAVNNSRTRFAAFEVTRKHLKHMSMKNICWKRTPAGLSGFWMVLITGSGYRLSGPVDREILAAMR